jgi:acyl CoA:acetate/3-ketoacid CoA transferase beta subunit
MNNLITAPNVDAWCVDYGSSQQEWSAQNCAGVHVLPINGKGVVNRIITYLAVIDVTESSINLEELAPALQLKR